MTDVRQQLTEALDRAEGRARALLAEAQRTSLTLRERRLLGREIPGWHAWPEVEAMCGRELRMVEGTRRVAVALAEQAERAEQLRLVGDPSARILGELAGPWLGTPEVDHG